MQRYLYINTALVGRFIGAAGLTILILFFKYPLKLQ